VKFDQRRALRCFTVLLRRRLYRLLHLAAEHDLNTPQTPIEYPLGKPGYLKSSYGFQRLQQFRWAPARPSVLRDNQNHVRCDNQALLTLMSFIQRKLPPAIMLLAVKLP
jgi:hypothetical protein